jgi:hypothetical protein
LYDFDNDFLKITGTNDTERMRIDSSGNVGIGTSSPAFKLDVAGAIHSSAAITGQDFRSDAGTTFYITSGSDWRFRSTSGTERMRIDAAGNVGIGTTSPSGKLNLATVASTACELRLTSNNTGSGSGDRGRISVHSSRNDGTAYEAGRIEIDRSNGTEDKAHIMFYTNNGSGTSERMRIDSSGNVGIGTTSPSSILTLNHATNPSIRFEDSGTKVVEINAEGSSTNIASFEGKALVFATSTSSSFSERMRIDSSGRLLLGASTSAIVGGGGASLYQIETTSGNSISCVAHRGTGNASGSIFILGKSRGTAAGSTTAVASGDELGSLRFAGADGTDLQSRGGEISCEVDGTPGSNDMPGRLLFKTTADGSAAPTERMRIDSSGRLLVGTSSARTIFKMGASGNGQTPTFQFETANDDTNNSLSLTYGRNNAFGAEIFIAKHRGASVGGTTIVQGGDRLGALTFAGSDGTNFQPAASIEAEIDLTPGTDDMPGRLVFSTTADGAIVPTERMRIDSSGDIFVNTTSQINAGKVSVAFNGSTRCCYALKSTNVGGADNFRFFNSTGTQVGSITHNNSTSAYNTTSDYRLKENISAISDGITRLKTLKPLRFNFKADASTTVDGFLAHEVTAVPEAISGTKDEVDSDNNPVYQGIDQSKLVPLLVAAVQELIGRVETLEAA